MLFQLAICKIQNTHPSIDIVSIHPCERNIPEKVSRELDSAIKGSGHCGLTSLNYDNISHNRLTGSNDEVMIISKRQPKDTLPIYKIKINRKQGEKSQYMFP